MDCTRPPGRYVDRETDDGGVMIVDTENDDAWIRSDRPVAISWQT